jgi:hypothetical protein
MEVAFEMTFIDFSVELAVWAGLELCISCIVIVK